MGTLFTLLVFGSLIAAIVFFVMAIVSVVKKNGKGSNYFIFTGIAVLFFFALFVFVPDSESTQSADNTSEETRITDEELKAKAQTIEYAQLEKNTSRYEGDYVKYTGQIMQITEYDDNYTDIRLAVTETDFGWDYDDAIYVEYDGYTDFVEDDVVTVYGEISGPYSYESVAGWEITIPGVYAQIIEQEK